jgi:hypothetical protein
MPISGLAVAYTTVGGIILWSGIKGETLADTFKGLASGTPPTTDNQEIGTPELGIGKGTASATTDSTTASPDSSSAAPGDTSAHSASAAANQAVGKLLAASYGWATGTQWTDLVSLWNQESGWSSTIANTSSGALGIAQALGHSTAGSAGTLGDEYGAEYGLTTANAVAANSGNASQQIRWGLGYIQSRYGSPSAAWAMEESAGYY